MDLRWWGHDAETFFFDSLSRSLIFFGRRRRGGTLALSMTIPEPSPGDTSLAPGSFSLSAGDEGKAASSAEPQRRGARVVEEEGSGSEKKKSRSGDDPTVTKKKRRTKTRQPPPRQHWAASLVASAGGTVPVILGLGVAVATVTVARAVVASHGKRRSKSGEVSEGIFPFLFFL